MTRPSLAAEPLEPRSLPAAPFQQLPVIPASDPATIDTIRAIVARGESLGRDPGMFLNAGDSNSSTTLLYDSAYLEGFGNPSFDPVLSGLAATAPQLIDTLAVYRASGSFSRLGTAAYPGWGAAEVLAALPGEIAATRAGVGLVMIGTNDVTRQTDPAEYRHQLEDIVRSLMGAGVVPVLSTIPPDAYLGGDHSGQVAVFNQIVADVTGEFHVPLWNLWAGLTALPLAGLLADGVHLSHVGDGVTFTPAALGAGQNTRNLEALEVLDWFRHTGIGPADVPQLPAWTPLSPHGVVAASVRGEGQAAVVSVYDAGGSEVDRFLAFEPGFTGGARVATADVTGDGVPDVVVGAGLGGGPAVKVFSGADGSLAASFFAFEPSFRSGVNVAAADLDGDGVAEIVVGAGDGGGPAVAVYHGGDFAERERFFAFEPSFRGGVTVAAGDVAGIGPAVVTGAGVGGGPVVKVFRPGDAAPAFDYFAYDPTLRTGVQVGVADLGSGGEVATAPASGPPHVEVTDAATGTVSASFFAPVGNTTGVRLGVLHEGGGADALLLGNGTGEAVGGWAYRDGTAEPYGPNDPARAYGVYVG